VAIALIVAFIARPVAVFAMTSADSFSTNERVLLSWAGLRGAMPVILATVPITQGLPNSLGYFNVVFVVVLASALLQGATIQQLTRMLGLEATSTSLPEALAAADTSHTDVLEATYLVSPASDVIGRNTRDLHLPTGAGLSVVVRSGHAFSPSDSTRIWVGDELHFVVAAGLADLLQAHLANWSEPAVLTRPAVPVPAPEPRWAPFQRRSLRTQGAGLVAHEMLWWRQLPLRLRWIAMRLWTPSGRRL
jgi:cell volume regulation protein A